MKVIGSEIRFERKKIIYEEIGPSQYRIYLVNYLL